MTVVLGHDATAGPDEAGCGLSVGFATAGVVVTCMRDSVGLLLS